MMPKSSEIEGLLARLEAATGPDREIDRWLQLLLVQNGRRGRFKTNESWIKAAREQRWATNHFTRSIDAALELVERCLPGTWYVMAKGQTRPDEPLFAHQILDVDEDRQLGIGEGATQPLAILIALLRALSARPRP